MKLSIITLLTASAVILTGCQTTNSTTQEEITQLSLEVNDLKQTVSVLNEQVESLNSTTSSGGLTLEPNSATYTVETTDPTQPVVEITNIEPAAAVSDQNIKNTLKTLSQDFPGSANQSKYKGKKYIVASGVSTSDVQAALTNAGYNPGAIDGKIGKRTISAIKRFQRSEKLKVDGVVGRRTWSRLSKHL